MYYVVVFAGACQLVSWLFQLIERIEGGEYYV